MAALWQHISSRPFARRPYCPLGELASRANEFCELREVRTFRLFVDFLSSPPSARRSVADRLIDGPYGTVLACVCACALDDRFDHLGPFLGCLTLQQRAKRSSDIDAKLCEISRRFELESDR